MLKQIFILFSILGLFFIISPTLSVDVYKGLQLKHVSRDIDLSSQLVRHKVVLEVENVGSTPASEMYFAVQQPLAEHLAFFSVSDSTTTDNSLNIGKATKEQKSLYFPINFTQSLAAGSSITLTATLVFSHVQQALPAEIAQNEPQLMKYLDNLYFYSPYSVKSQQLSVKLPSSTIESFTQFHPFSVKNSVISYGPYQDIQPLEINQLTLHFEHPGPFLTISNLERIIEISQWGNINVEEHYEMKNDGAKLRGQFSRFEYRRGRNLASIRSTTCVLPADARDIYYRDEIGNISTSALSRIDNNSISFELFPRFPLFGGWKTQFYIGYDLPLADHLFVDYNTGKYVLSLPFVPTFTSDVVVDDYTLKIILPEGASDISKYLPFTIESEESQKHFTYLDTQGRPVVILKKHNVISDHNKVFQVSYNFSVTSMLREPLLLIGVYFLLFLGMIAYSRFFS